MAQETRTEVVIAGRKYAIMSDDSPEYIKYLAKNINDSIGEMICANRSMSVEQAAILTALKYFDDIQKLKDKSKTPDDEDRLMKQIISYADELSKVSQENKNLKKIVQRYESEMKK